MRNLLYVIAIILLLAWAIALIGFQAGGFIHFLPVFAVVALLFRVIQGKRAL